MGHSGVKVPHENSRTSVTSRSLPQRSISTRLVVGEGGTFMLPLSKAWNGYSAIIEP